MLQMLASSLQLNAAGPHAQHGNAMEDCKAVITLHAVLCFGLWILAAGHVLSY